ncbi:MAG: hypothetical protein F6K14_00185 [Symploca sp. SIO2C1]|nr:hypothetical protein [Symploca sp. SIO2C1]
MQKLTKSDGKAKPTPSRGWRRVSEKKGGELGELRELREKRELIIFGYLARKSHLL